MGIPGDAPTDEQNAALCSRSGAYDRPGGVGEDGMVRKILLSARFLSRKCRARVQSLDVSVISTVHVKEVIKLREHVINIEGKDEKNLIV